MYFTDRGIEEARWPARSGWPRGAGPAGVGRKLDHDGVGAALGGRAPPGGGLALRAPRLLGVEVDGETGPVRPRTGPGLPELIGQQRADQRDPPAAQAVDDQRRGRVARVEVVLRRHRGRGVAGLGDVDLVTVPVQVITLGRPTRAAHAARAGRPGRGRRAAAPARRCRRPPPARRAWSARSAAARCRPGRRSGGSSQCPVS